MSGELRNRGKAILIAASFITSSSELLIAAYFRRRWNASRCVDNTTTNYRYDEKEKERSFSPTRFFFSKVAFVPSWIFVRVAEPCSIYLVWENVRKRQRLTDNL